MVLDRDDAVIAEHRVATPASGPALVAAVSEVVAALRPSAAGQLPVGVGVPGLVDHSGTLRFAPHLRAVTDFALRDELLAGPLAGVPLVVDNDATCAVWGGAPPGRRPRRFARADGHARDRDRWGPGPRWSPATGEPRLCRRDRPHRGGSPGSAVPVRPAGMLGALRLGLRPRPDGPRGGRGRCGPTGGRADWERARRPAIAQISAEIRGAIDIPLGDATFKLSGIADRIERNADGRYVILDYKTGSARTEKQVRTGLAPQLTLEAAILRQGGFKGIPKDSAVAQIGYVLLKGGARPGEPKLIDFTEGTAQISDCAGKALKIVFLHLPVR